MGFLLHLALLDFTGVAFVVCKLRQDPSPAKRLLCVLEHYGGLEPNCNIFKVCLPIPNLIREGVGRKGLWEEQMGF